ncbi:hypothetical protein FN846DRAFT_970214 [Sphaerosporella brunnea]|uniref:Uncharacterized protein n=1 Tax=Sphaerosporella brunnea TaxID=1250544 RepID=A0A5J5EHW4_9PEZI|nr:hypothetical protein FN846DRAFT_970214 [Sphaerosporella brunnea]
MNGMCTSSASFEWPTSPFDHALLGDHHGRTEEDVLAVLNLLNPYPIINIDIFGNHGHTLLELTARGYFLRSDVLEMVLRRLPLHSADAYFVIWRFLRYPNCTGAHIRALLRAGVEFPADGYEGPISTGNAELMEWLRKHVRGFVPSAEAMWRYLHGLLLFCELPFPWPDHLDPLLEVMVRISICLHPSGFTGQTLCLAIMSASWLTGRWTRNGHSIPRRWIWDLVYAMIRAGADVQEPWNDTQRPISPGYAHRPNYARSRDEPRLVGYLGWTASEMLSERERVGTL